MRARLRGRGGGSRERCPLHVFPLQRNLLLIVLSPSRFPRTRRLSHVKLLFRYRGFRDQNGEYLPEYFHLLAIRLSFVIIFEVSLSSLRTSRANRLGIRGDARVRWETRRAPAAGVASRWRCHALASAAPRVPASGLFAPSPARGFRHRPPHRHHGSRHPRGGGAQDEEGALHGQGGPGREPGRRRAKDGRLAFQTGTEVRSVGGFVPDAPFALRRLWGGR